MVRILPDKSLTFNDFLLIPNLTLKKHAIEKISLSTPLVKFRKGEKPALKLQMPMVSAVMQAVSNDTLAIALAKCGGMSFIFGSQPIAEQAEMVRRVKNTKAGFVTSRSNLPPNATLADALELYHRNQHSTIAVTADGTATGLFLGLLFISHINSDFSRLDDSLHSHMIPHDRLATARESITLQEANRTLWEQKARVLVILNEQRHLVSLVFSKDVEEHKRFPNECIDKHKRLMVGAGISTHDYRQRIPALVEAGVDCLVIDSSDGHSEWQKDTISFIRENYGDTVKC